MARPGHLRTATINSMGMGMAAYGRLLRQRTVRSVLLLALVIRIPVWAAMIVLTLHVVEGLDRSYSAAGVVTMVNTVALAFSAPWRGRSLDRAGLRATIAPQLVVLTAVWAVAPFAPYAVLLGLVVLGGLANLPTFSVVRQALIAAVDDRDRKAALSLDALFTEVSFMIGPVVGVLLAQWWGTTWALLVTQILAVVGGVGLWIANPALVTADAVDPASADALTHGVEAPVAGDCPSTSEAAAVPARIGALWRDPVILALLAACTGATVVLNGTDLGIVGALRDMDEPGSIGTVLAIWGLGSAVGAFVYGALHRPVPVFVLLALLAGTTIPVALADDRLSLALLLLVCGLFCAPTITAVSEALSRVVHESQLGEALGWQGLAFTVGAAVGAPLAGYAIDRFGWQGAFVGTGGVALATALVALVLQAGRARAPVEPVPRDLPGESERHSAQGLSDAS